MEIINGLEGSWVPTASTEKVPEGTIMVKDSMGDTLTYIMYDNEAARFKLINSYNYWFKPLVKVKCIQCGTEFVDERSDTDKLSKPMVCSDACEKTFWGTPVSTTMDNLTSIQPLIAAANDAGVITEVVSSALEAMQSDPKITQLQAMQIGCREWDVNEPKTE